MVPFYYHIIIYIRLLSENIFLKYRKYSILVELTKNIR